MNRFISAGFGLALLVTGTAAFSATSFEAGLVEVTGNVTLTSDYRFRGIAQADRTPAVQGGFDVALPNGFYLGTWASNVNFTPAAIELNYFAGYATELANGLELDVGVLYYNYPKGPASDLDFFEVYTSVGYNGLTLGLDYSPDYFDGTGRFFYLSGAYEHTLMPNLGLALHVGYSLLEDESFLAHHSKDEYFDWRVSLFAEHFGLLWDVAYVDTNLSRGQCFGGEKLCKGTVVLSVSKSL
jgi:uncharacterized protein (TIGR02001 family)